MGTTAMTAVRAALVEKARDDASGTGIAAVPAVVMVAGEDFRCEECSLDFTSFQGLQVHNARKHGKLRWARRKVRGTTCRTCLRKFATRSKLLEHLHARITVCYVNLMLYADDLQDEVREMEDSEQCESETALRKRGLHICYREKVVRQCGGPLQAFVIPFGHSRQSRYTLSRRALKCKSMTKEVDFDKVLEALEWTDGACIQDVVAMDVLATLW